MKKVVLIRQWYGNDLCCGYKTFEAIKKKFDKEEIRYLKA